MLRWTLVAALVCAGPALAVDESDLADLIERGEKDAARALIDEGVVSPSTDSVKAVADEIVILDDGSIYKVWPSYERTTVSTWKHDDVFVTSDDKMVNVDSMEVVEVRRVD